MTEDLISSPANPLLKRFRKLKTSKERSRERATAIEGIAPVWQAVDHAEVDALIVCPELLRSERAASLVAGARTGATSVVQVTVEAFTSIAERDNPSGLAAIVRTRDRSPADLSVEQDSLFAVLVDVAGPGNLGTVIRTADAVGAAVLVCGDSTDPWHPACVKASMGTVFSTPVARAPIDEAIDWCRGEGVTIVTTSARGVVDHWSTTYDLPAALVFGSERHGLSRETISQGDARVRIPMDGRASSLNLAVAAGILLYEARRPRT